MAQMESLNIERTSVDYTHVPSFVEMLDFYDMCIQIGKYSAVLLDHSEEMEVLSLNSEIAAAHSTINKEAFIVLANESGKIAKRMSDIVHQIQEDSHSLAKLSLGGVIQSRSYDKFAETLQSDDLEGLRPENVELIRLALAAAGSKTKGIIKDIFNQYLTIENNRSNFAQQNKKIEIVSVYFRIEASRDEMQGKFFNNIADSLADLCDRTKVSIDDMANLQRYWRSGVQTGVSYRRKGELEFTPTTTIQFSRGNVQFRAPSGAFCLRDLVDLRLSLGAENLLLKGVVRRVVQDEDGEDTIVGVAFANMDEALQSKIEAFTSQTSEND